MTTILKVTPQLVPFVRFVTEQLRLPLLLEPVAIEDECVIYTAHFSPDAAWLFLWLYINITIMDLFLKSSSQLRLTINFGNRHGIEQSR